MSGDKPKRGRGRQAGFVMTHHHRTKIAKSQILKKLIECAEGKGEMSSVQANVGLGLLKKVMPDMVAIGGDNGMDPIKTEETGTAKLAAFMDTLAERSGTTGDT